MSVRRVSTTLVLHACLADLMQSTTKTLNVLYVARSRLTIDTSVFRVPSSTSANHVSKPPLSFDYVADE